MGTGSQQSGRSPVVSVSIAVLWPLYPGWDAGALRCVTWGDVWFGPWCGGPRRGVSRVPPRRRTVWSVAGVRGPCRGPCRCSSGVGAPPPTWVRLSGGGGVGVRGGVRSGFWLRCGVGGGGCCGVVTWGDGMSRGGVGGLVGWVCGVCGAALGAGFGRFLNCVVLQRIW